MILCDPWASALARSVGKHPCRVLPASNVSLGSYIPCSSNTNSVVLDTDIDILQSNQLFSGRFFLTYFAQEFAVCHRVQRYDLISSLPKKCVAKRLVDIASVSFSHCVCMVIMVATCNYDHVRRSDHICTLRLIKS